jgi:hypothetical protein
MKTLISTIIAFVLLVATAHSATTITEQNTWQETYPVNTASPKLVISNIWGNVRVKTGKSGEISVLAVEVRTAPDRERFNLSYEILGLDIEADAGGVSMRVGQSDERWQRMGDCDGCRVDYQFEIVVPPGAQIDVGTVLDGVVDVHGVTGTVSASNVNGPIRIDSIQDCETISSVNGRVELKFSKAPSRDCSIETINGDITLGVPSNASMDVALDLFNGDVASDFRVDSFTMPATVVHVVEDGQNTYRIQKLSGVRIGAGGPTYSISSMNGDVRIQEHQ